MTIKEVTNHFLTEVEADCTRKCIPSTADEQRPMPRKFVSTGKSVSIGVGPITITLLNGHHVIPPAKYSCSYPEIRAALGLGQSIFSLKWAETHKWPKW